MPIEYQTISNDEMSALYENLLTPTRTIDLNKLETELHTSPANLINAKDSDGRTFLQCMIWQRGKENNAITGDPAALQDVDEAVKKLLQAGADKTLTEKNNKNWAALHFACPYGTAEMVQTLLNNGATKTMNNNSREIYSLTEQNQNTSQQLSITYLLILYGCNIYQSLNEKHDRQYEEIASRTAELKKTLTNAGDLFFDKWKLQGSGIEKLPKHLLFSTLVKPFLEGKGIYLPDATLDEIFFPTINTKLKFTVPVEKKSAIAAQRWQGKAIEKVATSAVDSQNINRYRKVRNHLFKNDQKTATTNSGLQEQLQFYTWEQLNKHFNNSAETALEQPIRGKDITKTAARIGKRLGKAIPDDLSDSKLAKDAKTAVTSFAEKYKQDKQPHESNTPAL